MYLEIPDIRKSLTLGIFIFSLFIVFSLIVLKAGSSAPIYIFALGVIPISIYLVTRIKGGLLLLFLLLGIPTLELRDGINIIELPFYFTSALLSSYLVAKVLAGKVKIENILDISFLFLLFVLLYGCILGILNHQSVKLSVSEFSFFVGILYYFPIKESLPEQKFRKALLLVISIFIGYVLIRNVINYRAIIVQAVFEWQAEKARVAANEFILLMGCIFTLSFSAISEKVLSRVLFILLFTGLFGGLILTQSRGYWLAFLVGVFAVFWVIDKEGKKKIFFTFATLSIAGIAIGMIFFNDLFTLVIDGLILRFQSIGSGSLDISLKDRYNESIEVLKLISVNPIMGYGLGTTFTRHSLISDVFIKTSFIHNGYLAAWFKFGISGLFAFTSIWFLNIRYATKVYSHSNNSTVKAISLTIIGTTFGVLLVNNTSAQILLMESILFISLGSAFLSYYLSTEYE